MPPQEKHGPLEHGLGLVEGQWPLIPATPRDAERVIWEIARATCWLKAKMKPTEQKG